MDIKCQWLGCSASAFLTAVQSDTTLQIIQFVLTMIATSLTIGYTIYKWWKQANEDGHIDKEEIEELAENILEEVTELKNEMEDLK